MGLMKDDYGLVRAGTDGGDSCQRTYSVLLLSRLLWEAKAVDEVKNDAYATAITINPGTAQKLLEPEPGIYIRSPDPDWTSDLRVASRDQLTPVICFLAVMANSPSVGEFYRMKLGQLLKACLKRGMFAQNTIANGVSDVYKAPKKMPDFLNPDLWSVFASGYMRTYWAPLAYLVMLFGDLFGVFGAIFKVWAPVNKDGTFKFRMPGPDDCDDTNANNVHVTRQMHWPTPLSWLARKIYMLRGKNYGNTQLGETSSVMGAIAWYNRNDNTDITELHRPLVERY